MGLCKCPKRRVTNQFCFEHRVNVCEHCMVTNHPKCIIQSYLQWLQDSDYNPICELCSKELVQDDCIRLTCYHVFHWTCLDQSARQLPSTTAPAGYSCPSCRMALFPPSNLVSPVADVLRQKLAAVNWARAGLGLPLLSDDREAIAKSSAALPQGINSKQAPLSRTSLQNGFLTTPGSQQQEHSGPPYSVVHMEDQDTSSGVTSKTLFNQVTAPAAARRVFQDVRENKQALMDHDDDKYKRRPVVERFSRFWRNSLLSSGHRRPTSIYKKYCMLGIIAFIAIVVIIMFMDRYGRLSAENDPILDLRQNDQIRVKDTNAQAQRSM